MKRAHPWAKLAAEMADEGVQSVYLDRLRVRIDPAQAIEDIQKEIAGEIARALGRTEEQLLGAFAQLDLCAARHDRARAALQPAREVEALREAFNAQRSEVERRLRDLVIHREAAGFRRNQVIYDLYPLPPRR